MKKVLTNRSETRIIINVADSDTTEYAGMAELADALDSGSNVSNDMEVQVLLPAPKSIERKFDAFLFYRFRFLLSGHRIRTAPLHVGLTDDSRGTV